MRDADGQIRPLKAGDTVRKGEVVLTDQDGIVQIEARRDGEPDAIERIIAEVDRGNPDVAPAAGPQGGDGDLQPGLRVDRVTETVTPAGMATEAYAAPTQAARANEADPGTGPDEATPDIATPDTVTLAEDGSATFDPRTNDDFASASSPAIQTVAGQPIAVGSPVTLPQGTVTLHPDGTLSFTPVPDFNGTVVIPYTAGNGGGTSVGSTITVTVTPVNDAPTANPDAARANEDSMLVIDPRRNDTDPDGDPLTITHVNGQAIAVGAPVTLPEGTLSLNPDGTLSFQPVPDYNGSFSFDYTVADGHGGEATASVSLTVDPANDAPVAVNDLISTPINTPLVGIAVLANDTDGDGDQLTVTGATVAPAFGTVTVNADGTLNFTPMPNVSGPVTVTYTISDGHGGTSSATLTVNVGASNPPTGSDASYALAEDTSRSFTATDFGFADADPGQTMAAVRIDSLPPAGTLKFNGAPVAAGQVIPADALSNLSFTPAANASANAYASFTFSVQDSAGAFDASPNTITLDVTPADDASVLADDTAATAEDTPVSGNVLSNDEDADNALSVASFTVAGVTGTFNAGQTAVITGVGSLVLATDGSYTFTPAANFNGAVPQVSYTTSTGSTATLSITVTPDNDAPVGVDDAATTPINSPLVAIAVLANDTDADGDQLTVTGAAVDPSLGTVTVNPDGTLNFTPALDVSGPVTVTYTIADGQGGTSSATLTVNVGANHAPTGSDATYALAEDASRSFTPGDFGFADADPGQTMAAVRIDTLPVGGTLTFNGASVFAGQVLPAGALANLLFTPAANANGNAYASFTFSVQDPAGSFDASPNTITLNVNPVDDASVLVADTSTTAEDIPVSGNVLANDSDVDDALAVASFAVAGVAGSFTAGQTAVIAGVGSLMLASDGSYTFTPAANYNGSVPQVSYTTNTGSTSTLDITVTPVNDAPVAVGDVAATPINTPISNIAVLANDTDVDGDALAVTSATVDPALGTVVVNPDGTLAFTPALNVTGPVTVTYSIADGQGGTSTATLVVNVGSNNPPTGADAAFTVPEDGSRLFAAADFGFADADPGQTLAAVRIDTLPGAGTLTLNGAPVAAGQVIPASALADLLFTPAANANGNAYASFTFSVQDSAGSFDTTPNTITLNVTPVDDASVLVADAATTAEDAPVSGNVLANDSDVDDALAVASFTVAGVAGSFTAGQTAVIAGVGSLMLAADGSYTFTPGSNYNGSVPQLSYTTSTGSTSTLDITVTPVNDAPVLSGESVATLEDTTVTGNVLANDADIDGGALAVTSFSWDGVVHAIAAGASTTTTVAGVGTLTVASDGSYSFEPASHYSGQVPVVIYTVSDGSDSSTAALDLGVTALADAPTLVLNSTTIVDGDSSDTGLPASTGLTREFHDELALTTAAATDATNLETAVEAATATSVSTVTNVAIAQPDFDTGDAYRYSGYVYLEAGHTYALSGNRDDTMIIKIGGETVYSLGFNNWGSFTAQGFTPAVSGYYSLEVNVFNGDGIGGLDVNVSVDGAAAVDLNTTNFDLYADADDITGSAAGLGDFVSNNDGGFYPGAPTGSDGSFISLGSVTASLADTDGSESLAITVSAIPVGATLSDGTHSFTATAGVTSVDVSTWELGALQFMSASGFSGVVDLTVTATATEASNGSTASSAGGLRVIIANATPPDLFTADTLIVVNQGTSSASTHRQVAFPVAVALADGETLSSLVVNSLPVGVVISDGTNSFTASMADNSVDVSSWNLSSLTLTVPTSFSNTGTTITVTATSTVYAEVDGVTTAIDSASTADSLTLIADYTTTTTTGSGANDTLNGTVADNHIDAAAGNDTVSAADGNDLVLGGAGDDSIGGGAGTDVLYGGTGNDTLVGGSQSDRLIGGAGNDTLTGGSGGNDLVTDVFQWQLGDGGAAGSPAADTITDFNASAATAGGDILDLRDLLVGDSSSNLTDYLHFSTSGGSTVVSISTNGAFAGGYDSGLVNQTITLAGIDLVGAKTDAQIIEDLLKNGSLVAGG